MMEPTTPKRRNPLGSLGRKSWDNLRSKLSPGRTAKDSSGSPSQFIVLSSHLDLYEKLAQQKVDVSIEQVSVEHVSVEPMPNEPVSIDQTNPNEEFGGELPEPRQSRQPLQPLQPHQSPPLDSLQQSLRASLLEQPLQPSPLPPRLEPSLLPALKFDAPAENADVNAPKSPTFDEDNHSYFESDNTSAFSFEKPIRQRSALYYKPVEPAQDDFSDSNSYVGSDLNDEDNVWDDEEDLSHLDPDYDSEHADFFDETYCDDIIAEVNRVPIDPAVDLRRANTDVTLARRNSKTIRRGNTVVTLFERSNSAPTRTLSVRSAITPIKE